MLFIFNIEHPLWPGHLANKILTTNNLAKLSRCSLLVFTDLGQNCWPTALLQRECMESSHVVAPCAEYLDVVRLEVIK